MVCHRLQLSFAYPPQAYLIALLPIFPTLPVRIVSYIPPQVCRLTRQANMENDWLDGNWASDYETLKFLNAPRGGTAAEQASQVALHRLFVMVLDLDCFR